MAIPAAAVAAARAAATYGPSVIEAARKQLAKATGGKVTDPSAVATYVGSSPQRMSVVTGALVRSGMDIDDVIPADLVGNNEQLAKIRESGRQLVSTLQNRFEAGSDKSLTQSSSDIAADILRRDRVAAALSVFFTAKNYMLCNPNGGIPAADFVWYDRVIRGVRG